MLIKKYALLLLLSSVLFSQSFDYKVKLDESGFWGAHYDVPRYYFYGVLGLAAIEGTTSKIGKTSWQAIDAGIISQILAEGSKAAFGRVRPRDTDSPNEWFKDGKSFFSGHVSGMAAIVTPYVLAYEDDYPIVHALWLLPAYQMVGRVKAQAHWQSDVVVGALMGFVSGYFAYHSDYPFTLYFVDGNAVAGLRYSF